jgi:tetratricopeptide (TPR) repeat protein
MDFYANETKTGGKERIQVAIEYLKQGRSAQAFLLLSDKKDEKEPAALFALGLCRRLCSELPEAIQCFEQSLKLLKAASAPAKAAYAPAENSEEYIRLSIEQIKEKVYLGPMDIDFCERFPKAAEQNILLALIDTYRQNRMEPEAKRLSAALTGPIFDDYKNRLGF